MVSLLAHPFRVTGTGACATVEQASDEQFEQQIRIIAGTRQGERLMCLQYGLPDPAWRGLFIEDIQSVCDLWGPPVTIGDLSTTIVNDMEQIRAISWVRGS